MQRNCISHNYEKLKRRNGEFLSRFISKRVAVRIFVTSKNRIEEPFITNINPIKKYIGYC